MLFLIIDVSPLFAGKNSVLVEAGDAIHISTPGGGGWGEIH